MPKIPNWEKISETHWEFEKDVYSEDYGTVIIKAKIIEDRDEYVAELSIEEKISDITSTKVEGYTIGMLENKEKLKQQVNDFRRDYRSANDFLDLPLPNVELTSWEKTTDNSSQTIWIDTEYYSDAIDVTEQGNMWVVEAVKDHREENLGSFDDRYEAEKRAEKWLEENV